MLACGMPTRPTMLVLFMIAPIPVFTNAAISCFMEFRKPQTLMSKTRANSAFAA